MVKLELIKDNNGHDHLMFLIDRDEIMRLMYLNKFGPGVCDGCNESIFETEDKDMYLIPELRDTHCHKCSQDYFKRMKHYKEDMEYLAESIRAMIKFFEFDLTEEDKRVVDNYIKYLKELEEILPATD